VKYKIEIWVYGTIRDVYESENIEGIYTWYKDRWQEIYEFDGCTFFVFENKKEIPYKDLIKYGF